MIAALALLQNAWTAFSPLAAIAGLSGLGLLALAFLGLSWLPAFLRRPLIAVGVLLLASAAIYQAGTARGAHDAFALDAERALAAERTRTEVARKITDAVAIQAVRDLTAAAAANTKLKEINDALRDDPNRDRVCIDRDLSRRLREL